MATPTPPTTDHRLAELGAVARRWRMQNMTQVEAARRAGFDVRTWQHLEKGIGLGPRSQSGVEKVVGWPPGTIDAFRSGARRLPALVDPLDTKQPMEAPSNGDRLDAINDKVRKISDELRIVAEYVRRQQETIDAFRHLIEDLGEAARRLA